MEIYLEGPAAIGKTTLLKNIDLKCSERNKIFFGDYLDNVLKEDWFKNMHEDVFLGMYYICYLFSQSKNVDFIDRSPLSALLYNNILTDLGVIEAKSKFSCLDLLHRSSFKEYLKSERIFVVVPPLTECNNLKQLMQKRNNGFDDTKDETYARLQLEYYNNFMNVCIKEGAGLKFFVPTFSLNSDLYYDELKCEFVKYALSFESVKINDYDVLKKFQAQPDEKNGGVWIFFKRNLNLYKSQFIMVESLDENVKNEQLRMNIFPYSLKSDKVLLYSMYIKDCNLSLEQLLNLKFKFCLYRTFKNYLLNVL